MTETMAKITEDDYLAQRPHTRVRVNPRRLVAEVDPVAGFAESRSVLTLEDVERSYREINSVDWAKVNRDYMSGVMRRRIDFGAIFGVQPDLEPIPPPPVQAPRPSPATLPEAKWSPEYRALATKVGAIPREIADYEMREYLAGQGLPIYPPADVIAYLKDRAEIMAKKHEGEAADVGWNNLWNGRFAFGWVGLRTCDRPQTAAVLIGGSHRAGPYNLAIPGPVLETVAGLIQRFGDRVQFAVSEIYRDPDPFLLVNIDHDQNYIVERWDEPSFRMR
jgi:hypothetical protein